LEIDRNLKQLFSLEDKVILITGASGGLGVEFSKSLAGLGAKIALCDIEYTKTKDLEREILEQGNSAQTFKLDLADLDSVYNCVKNVISHYGRVDVLINNAAQNKREGFLDVEEVTFDRIMDVNVKGAFFLSQEIGRHMVENKISGSIINVVSSNAVNMLGGLGVYGASKAAMWAITRAQAIELAKHNIRSNALSPGSTLTPLTAPIWSDPKRSDYLRERIAMARPANPEDLLGMLVLLCSDASRYMTGTMHHVDGGYLAGGQPWPYDTAY